MWETLTDILLYIPRQTYYYFTQGLAHLIGLIPLPDFLNSMNLSGLTSAGYFLDAVSFTYGFTLVTSALIARFLLRRIPFIGG